MISDDQAGSGESHPSSLEELGRRLSAVIDRVGSRQKAAMVSGRSTDQLAKYVKGTVEPPFLPLARLCKVAGVRMEWLSHNEGDMLIAKTSTERQSPALRHEEMTMAIQLVEEAIEGQTLEPPKRAELIGLVYEGLVDGLPEAKVLRWARAALG